MNLWLRIIHAFASLFPLRIIPAENGEPYLARYRIFGSVPGSSWRGPSLYLHRFLSPDQDPAPHNHPWRRAVSLVLAGGYVEERLLKELEGSEEGPALIFWSRRLRPGHVNVIGSKDFHRVDRLLGEETWTLFLVWPKSRSWGFWVAGRGFVEWRARLAERGIPT